MPAKIQRKILKIGDSRAVALPPDWLRAFNLETGCSVEVLYNSIVLIKPPNFKVEPEFLKKSLKSCLNWKGKES